MKLELGGVTPGAAVRGEVVIPVQVSERIERVALYVNGKPVSRDGSPPYELRWSTETAEEGPHELTVYARAANGRRAAQTLTVVVANAEDVPAALLGQVHPLLGPS